jgi:flagellar M-ring protein FliF
VNAFLAMNTRQRIALGASTIGVLVVAFLLFRMMNQPSYSTIASGLDPARTGQMTAALDSQGVAYELQNNGTALAVKKGQTSKAQVALAAKGLTGTAQPGFELLDKQKLGASSFQQQVAYQRALEGQIAQTIGQIDGVSGAQVQITMPQDQLFADEQKPATAAVLLGGGPSTLDGAAVRGIANLVASSVPNLKTADVTITDGTGQLLWPTGDAGGTSGGLSKPAAEARYANELQTSLMAMLTRTLGPDKAQVQVNADLAVDQADKQQLIYAAKGTPLKVTNDVETLKGAGGTAGGAAGTTGNITGYTGTTGGGGKSNYKHTVKTEELGVNKTIVHTKVAPGAVNRLNVSLVLDSSVPAAQAAQLKQAVATAAGVNPARGDTMTLSQVKFAPLPKATAAPAGLPIPPAFAGILKGAGGVLAALAFLFFVSRHLRRREGEELMGEPSWLRQLDAPRTVAQLEAADTRQIPAADPKVSADAENARWALEDVVKREPERVAAQLKTWLAEDA